MLGCHQAYTADESSPRMLHAVATTAVVVAESTSDKTVTVPAAPIMTAVTTTKDSARGAASKSTKLVTAAAKTRQGHSLQQR